MERATVCVRVLEWVLSCLPRTRALLHVALRQPLNTAYPCWLAPLLHPCSCLPPVDPTGPCVSLLHCGRIAFSWLLAAMARQHALPTPLGATRRSHSA